MTVEDRGATVISSEPGAKQALRGIALKVEDVGWREGSVTGSVSCLSSSAPDRPRPGSFAFSV